MRILSLISLAFLPLMASAQTFITISSRGETGRARLADTAAASALASMLSSGPITVNLDQYGGFEMVGALPSSLPTDDRQITTSPGDIMLYVGSNIVFFYGSNSWAYTPLGKIEGMTDSEISRFLRGNEMTVTIELESTSLPVAAADESTPKPIYDLSGREVFPPLAPGLYIQDGRKIIVN